MKKILMITFVILLVFSGCSSGVSREAFDALLAENKMLRYQLNKMEESFATQEIDIEKPDFCEQNNQAENTEFQGYPPENDLNIPFHTESTQPSLSSSNSPVNHIDIDFLNHSQFNEFLHNGTYRCGTDFSPGNYYIMSLYMAEPNFSIASSPNDIEWGYQRVLNIVSINNGEYVKLTSGQIMVSDGYIDNNNLTKYNIFKVGEDIDSGDYLVELLNTEYKSDVYSIIGVGGSVQISDHTPFDKNAYVNILFNDSNQTYITLKNGQYLTAVNVRLTKVS